MSIVFYIQFLKKPGLNRPPPALFYPNLICELELSTRFPTTVSAIFDYRCPNKRFWETKDNPALENAGEEDEPLVREHAD